MKSTVYEILEVAPPDNRVSHFIQSFTILLVFLNTLALILSFLDFFKPNQIYFFWIVETLSTGFFALEYGLRLWSASASARFRGRLRFGLRLPLLIDLASTLPFFVVLFTPSRELTMRVLQLGWAIRHLKLLRYPQTPLVQTSCDALLHEAEERLAQIRQRLAKGREKDFTRVQQRIDGVSRQCDEASQRQHELQQLERQPLLPPTHPIESESTPFPSLIDQLEAELNDEAHIKETAALLVTAYQQSGCVFNAAPDRVPVQVQLGSGLVGQKLVPLRRIGRHHFSPLASRSTKVLANKHPLYVSDVRRELSRIRIAMTDALRHDDSPEGEVRLNQAIDQLRDVVAPVRLAWDALLFQLEDEHLKRLQFVRTDIERYGHPSFYGGRLWRWFIRRLSATLRIRELAVRLWSTILRLYRESVASISRFLRPALLRLGLIKPPIREMLLALDEARLDSVLERGLPAEYLALFDFSTLKDEGLCIGFDEELVHIRWAIERWQKKLVSSFIVYGHRGVGKSTLLTMARRHLFADQPVIHETLAHKITTTEALVEYLATLLGFPPGTASDAVAQLLLAGPRRAVLLDDCHHLFFRNVSGLEAVRYLSWLFATTNHHLLWGISLDKSGYDFLTQALPRDLIHVHVALEGRNSEELRRLIMTRHNRSGVSLHYVHDNRNDKALRRQMKALRQQHRSARVNPQEALELTFFDSLATACAGNIIVAFFYWLRSLRVEDPGRYHVQPFEALDLSLIWESSQEHAFILAALLQHGNLTAMELGQILDTDLIATRLELEVLNKLNILQFDPKTDTFDVNPVVQNRTCEMLRSRNLFH